MLKDEVEAWEADRNRKHAKANWQFAINTADARVKLGGCTPHYERPPWPTSSSKPQADGVELGRGERMSLWDGVSDGEEQPVGGGMQDKPHLVGERAAAAGAIGS